MRIANILERKGTTVITVDENRTVHEAICTLNEHSIGAVVVRDDDGAITGILTERDVLRECGERCTHLLEAEEPGSSGCPALVKDVMTKELIIGLPTDTLNYAMSVMSQNRIRHLPILDGSDLAGIVSIGDVVNAFVDEATFENRLLKDYIQGATY